MKKKVLVVVAHPDDETIWMGGNMLQNKDNWDITIISLCRMDDEDRAPKFHKVCKLYGARCFMSDLDDEKMHDLKTDETTSRVNGFLNKIHKLRDQEFDYVFTHGKNGEYGHKRHIDVHNAITKMVNKKSLPTKNLVYFSYKKKGEGCYAYSKADKFIKLNPSQLKLKKKIIQEVYGFQKGGFEEMCCTDLEAFDKLS
jgi:LmbE family N-acetylglucosaminyl deacetylase